MMNLRVIARGILRPIPIVGDVFKGKETGGAISARYCYSVWLRHLIMLYENGMPIMPSKVVEIGPGGSLGVGLCSLLSGAKYFAFDTVEHANTIRNIEVLDDLVKLFKQKSSVPDNKEFPLVKPVLSSYDFPEHILSPNVLENTLQKSNIELLKQSITNSSEDQSVIKYVIADPAANTTPPQKVDLILSQAVMEHVLDLEETYRKMYDILSTSGYMSHQIDFKAHETSKTWYGHRMCSDLLWRLIMQGRTYPINREPYAFHKKILKKIGFEIVHENPVYASINHPLDSFNKRYKNYSKEQLKISGIHIICKKRN